MYNCTSTDDVHMYVHKKRLLYKTKKTFKKLETGDTFVERLF